jgi:hypothetical protein
MCAPIMILVHVRLSIANCVLLMFSTCVPSEVPKLLCAVIYDIPHMFPSINTVYPIFFAKCFSL